MSAGDAHALPDQLSAEETTALLSGAIEDAREPSEEAAMRVATLVEHVGRGHGELQPEHVALLESWFFDTWSVRAPEAVVAQMLRVVLAADLPRARDIVRGSRPLGEAQARLITQAQEQLPPASTGEEEEEDEEEEDDYCQSDTDDEHERVPPSLQHARDVLGLGENASPESVKRAYLRQVKKHRPERDAEGFQRVRAAYDRARRTSAPSPPGFGVGFRAGAFGPREPLVEKPAPEHPLAPLIARAAALGRGDPAAIELWREAVAANPDSSLARQELYRALMACRQDAEAAAALVDAVRAGCAGFLHTLVTAHGALTPPDLLERAAEVPELQPAALRAWVGLRRWKQAAAVAIPVVERAMQSAEASVPLQDCIDTLFGLAREGRVKAATDLAARLETFVTHAPRELHRSGLAAHWALAQELAEAAEWLDPDVREALGAALLAEDVAAGRESLDRLLAKRDVSRDRIVFRAPLLAELFSVAAPPARRPLATAPEEITTGSEQSGEASALATGVAWPLGVLLAGGLLIWALSSARGSGSDASAPFVGRERGPQAAGGLEEEPDGSAELEPGDAAPPALEEAAKAVIERARERRDGRTLSSARRLLAAANRHDCAGVDREIRVLLYLSDPTNPHVDSHLADLCLDLTTAASAYCHSGEPTQ